MSARKELTESQIMEVLSASLGKMPTAFQIDMSPSLVSGLVSEITAVAKRMGFMVIFLNIENLEWYHAPVPMSAILEEELAILLRRGAANSSLVTNSRRHGRSDHLVDTLHIIDASDYEGESQLIDVKKRAAAFFEYAGVTRDWFLFIRNDDDEQNRTLGPPVADDFAIGWIRMIPEANRETSKHAATSRWRRS